MHTTGYGWRDYRMKSTRIKCKLKEQNKRACSLHRLVWDAFKPSKLPLSVSFTISSVACMGCSYQLSPLSLRRITISRSFPRREAKCGTSMMTGLQNTPISFLLFSILSFIYWLCCCWIPYSLIWTDTMTGSLVEWVNQSALLSSQGIQKHVPCILEDDKLFFQLMLFWNTQTLLTKYKDLLKKNNSNIPGLKSSMCWSS